MVNQPVAVVTGASRGIGRGIALELAPLGYAVVVNYVGNATAALETAAAVEQAGGAALPCQADISRSEDRARLVAETVRAFGRIDLLVNNAGVPVAQRVDLLDATEQSWDRVMSINLKGPYFLTQQVARVMVPLVQSGAARDAKIINISSISAEAASPDRGEYCVAKAGMWMMTQLYAARLAEHGILVYELRPGVIATDMTAPVQAKYDRLIADGLTPIRRWGEPRDVGRAVAAIARGDLPFTTGEVIHVDGGFHVRRL
jgi:NAD(P)-dependent dehydrogenase (short-subunit alcohol dehydrogenase family)